MVKRTFAVAAVCAALCGCHHVRAHEPNRGWLGTWGTAPQLTEPANMPPSPGLSGSTLRQVVHVSVGGARLRVHFSNEYGKTPLTIRSVHIALSARGSEIVPASERVLTFSGDSSVSLAAGATAVSDERDFALPPLSNVTISTFFDVVPAEVTGHPGSRTTSYLQTGNSAAARDMRAAVTATHWYVLTGIDVRADASSAAIAVMGNSITDGRGSGTDKQNRWPDELVRRLHADARTSHVAMLNMGIGGNCVLRACLGPAALARFERDVLEQSGVRWLIILEGVNDIGGARDSLAAASVARDLIAAYQTMIGRAHAAHIKVYGATIMPFGGSFYDRPDREAARQAVNAWIRTSRAFDAVIDTDAALRDPAQPTHLLPAYDSGDHLHPNEAGHHAMASSVDLRLFVVK